MQLPIDEVLPELLAVLRESNAVLVAPPGAGKTTRVPPALVDAGFGPVIVLEPRRIAARAAARRVAHERGWTLGQEVGYHVRFDRRASKQTRVLFCTEGVVLRRIQEDPFLEGVGCLMFDEFHERRLDADLVLAMARRVQCEAREDLRLIVTSATLRAQPVAEFLGDAPVVTSEGKLFPVTVRHEAPRSRGHERERLEDHLARVVETELESGSGDVLAFLPGVGEIRRAAKRLHGPLARRGVSVQELYGDLDPARQDAALRAGETRRVVLATNVAESSVTVSGVHCVVDSGLARVLRHDPGTGIDRLAIERIDRAAADQRTGRAGRLGEGRCVRLWSELDDRALNAALEPEVRRLDLCGPVLELACWGEPDALAFPWFEAPDANAVERARHLLRSLGALDEANRPTERGRAFGRFPLHPRLAALVLEGNARGAPYRAALAAALVAERDPFRSDRSAVRRDACDSDVFERVLSIEEFERTSRCSFPIGELNVGGARRLLQARDQIMRSIRPREGRESAEALGRAVLAGFPDRLCRRRKDDPERAVMVGGRGVRQGPRSAVTEEELYVALDVVAGTSRSGGESVVHMASGVDREWVDGGRTHVDVLGVFDSKSGRVIGRRRVMLGELVLEEADHPLQDRSEVERVLLAAAMRDPARALGLDRPEIAEVRARVACLSEWRPELGLPETTDDAFAALLPSLVGGASSFADLRAKPVSKAWLGSLTHEQRAALDRDAPERMQVPSGSHLKLAYEPGRPPVLAVKIQELFGSSESPTVAGGRVRVLLHLLAPNGRPQQVTDDLQSFWTNTYESVRKELRRRYPKHDWPEDPRQAKPSSRPKRRPRR